MTGSRVLTGIITAVFCLTLVSSARADSSHGDILLEKRIFAERHDLSVIDISLADTGYLYTGHFENNNGKHLGFSVAMVRSGPQLGIVRPFAPAVCVNSCRIVAPASGLEGANLPIGSSSDSRSLS